MSDFPETPQGRHNSYISVSATTCQRTKYEENTHAAAAAKISCLLACVRVDSATENITINIKIIAALIPPDT